MTILPFSKPRNCMKPQATIPGEFTKVPSSLVNSCFYSNSKKEGKKILCFYFSNFTFLPSWIDSQISKEPIGSQPKTPLLYPLFNRPQPNKPLTQDPNLHRPIKTHPDRRSRSRYFQNSAKTIPLFFPFSLSRVVRCSFENQDSRGLKWRSYPDTDSRGDVIVTTTEEGHFRHNRRAPLLPAHPSTALLVPVQITTGGEHYAPSSPTLLPQRVYPNLHLINWCVNRDYCMGEFGV